MLYIFDLDGTLIRSYMKDDEAQHSYDEVELLPGRRAKLRELRKQRGSTRFAIATNQGGVAFGYQTMAQTRQKLGLVVAELEMWLVPTTVHVAYGHPHAETNIKLEPDDYRKPGPGMLLEARRLHKHGSWRTIMIGDMKADEQAAKAAHVAFIHADEFFE